MDFGKALDYMKQGKRIRRRAWCPGLFAEVSRTQSGALYVNTNGLMFNRNDVLANDWEVYHD